MVILGLILRVLLVLAIIVIKADIKGNNKI